MLIQFTVFGVTTDVSLASLIYITEASKRVSYSSKLDEELTEKHVEQGGTRCGRVGQGGTRGARWGKVGQVHYGGLHIAVKHVLRAQNLCVLSSDLTSRTYIFSPVVTNTLPSPVHVRVISDVGNCVIVYACTCLFSLFVKVAQ